MNWDHLEKFVAVARAGSFTAAAERAGASAATLSRKVSALETALGLSLLRRGPEGVKLTEPGRRVLAAAERSAEALAEIERLARAGRSGQSASPVRVSATEPLLADILAPALGSLWAARPGLAVSLVSTTKVADLARDEADLALRLFSPKGDGLTARRLPDIEMGCFAAPGALERSTKPFHRTDLPLLAIDESYGPIAEVVWARENGLEDRIALRSTSMRVLLQAAAAGQGIVVAPRFLAVRHGLAPAPAPPAPNRQCWLVSHPDLARDKGVAAVKRWIVAAVTEALRV